MLILGPLLMFYHFRQNFISKFVILRASSMVSPIT